MQVYWLTVVLIALASAQNNFTCPLTVCSAGLPQNECMRVDGTDWNDAVFMLSPCEEGYICQYDVGVETGGFWAGVDATNDPFLVTKKGIAKCVERSELKKNLLPGSKCGGDHECRSNNCGGTCKGKSIGSTCTDDYQCEEGSFCNAMGICQGHIQKNQVCTSTTEVCENGYVCTAKNTSGIEHCREIFSIDDNVPATDPAGCRGGFLSGEDDGNCMTPYRLYEIGAQQLSDPYYCSKDDYYTCLVTDAHEQNFYAGT